MSIASWYKLSTPKRASKIERGTLPYGIQVHLLFYFIKSFVEGGCNALRINLNVKNAKVLYFSQVAFIYAFLQNNSRGRRNNVSRTE